MQPFPWAPALTISRGLLGGRGVKQVAPCAAVLVGTSTHDLTGAAWWAWGQAGCHTAVLSGNLLLTTGTIVFVSVHDGSL